MTHIPRDFTWGGLIPPLHAVMTNSPPKFSPCAEASGVRPLPFCRAGLPSLSVACPSAPAPVSFLPPVPGPTGRSPQTHPPHANAQRKTNVEEPPHPPPLPVTYE